MCFPRDKERRDKREGERDREKENRKRDEKQAGERERHPTRERYLLEQHRSVRQVGERQLLASPRPVFKSLGSLWLRNCLSLSLSRYIRRLDFCFVFVNYFQLHRIWTSPLLSIIFSRVNNNKSLCAYNIRNLLLFSVNILFLYNFILKHRKRAVINVLYATG